MRLDNQRYLSADGCVPPPPRVDSQSPMSADPPSLVISVAISARKRRSANSSNCSADAKSDSSARQRAANPPINSSLCGRLTVKLPYRTGAGTGTGDTSAAAGVALHSEYNAPLAIVMPLSDSDDAAGKKKNTRKNREKLGNYFHRNRLYCKNI